MISPVGVWSADARYGPGAQSDELVWFLEDGRGRVDWINFALCTVEFFQWEETMKGMLHVRPVRTLQWTDDGVEEQAPLLPAGRDLPYTIAQEHCPNEQVLEVLRVDLGREGAFARWLGDLGDFESPRIGL
jgi:hypothetical protein